MAETEEGIERPYVALQIAISQNQRLVGACVLRRRTRTRMDDAISRQIELFQFLDSDQVPATPGITLHSSH
jgi:hypothetical protein